MNIWSQMLRYRNNGHKSAVSNNDLFERFMAIEITGPDSTRFLSVGLFEERVVYQTLVNNEEDLWTRVQNACEIVVEILVFSNECASHVYVVLRHVLKMMEDT